MATKETFTSDAILAQINAGRFAPVYLFMGDESYYIDLLTEAIRQKSLTPDERDFNEITLYGSDVDIRRVIDECKFFPSFAERRVVIVKEAQQIGNLDELQFYLQKPLSSTVLVINYKQGNADRRKKWVSAIEKTGILFESKKLYDNQVPEWIGKFLGQRGYQMEAKAGTMLTDFLGTDLSKIVSELDKLMITLPENVKRITADHVEKNIGISKEYNNFEFQKALINRDLLKVNRIVNYFEQNPKANPIVVTLSMLFNYFSNLMICFYLKEKSEPAIVKELGLRGAFQARDYTTGLRNFKGMKVFEIISLLREYDAKAKGFGNSSATQGELLRELAFKILH